MVHGVLARIAALGVDDETTLMIGAAAQSPLDRLADHLILPAQPAQGSSADFCP